MKRVHHNLTYDAPSLPCVSEVLLVMGGAAQETYNPKENDGTYYGGDEVADNAGCRDSEQTEEPAAEYSADYTDDKIYYPAEATAAHQFASHCA